MQAHRFSKCRFGWADFLATLRIQVLTCGLLFLVSLVTQANIAASDGQDLVSKLRIEDINGKSATLPLDGHTKAIVFLFVSVECPISNSYAPEFRRLAAEFESNQVVFRLVYPNVDETTEAIRRHLRDFELPIPALRDPSHDLVKAAGVAMTPEAAVYVPGRGFVYQGRIDNRYVRLGLARPEATQHDLRDVLRAIVAGKPVPQRKPHAVGCSIAPLPSR
jgi:hypothetical protein